MEKSRSNVAGPWRKNSAVTWAGICFLAPWPLWPECLSFPLVLLPTVREEEPADVGGELAGLWIRTLVCWSGSTSDSPYDFRQWFSTRGDFAPQGIFIWPCLDTLLVAVSDILIEARNVLNIPPYSKQTPLPRITQSNMSIALRLKMLCFRQSIPIVQVLLASLWNGGIWPSAVVLGLESAPEFPGMFVKKLQGFLGVP